MTSKTTKDKAETHDGGEETHKGRRRRRRVETHKGRQRRNPQGAATAKASRDPQRAVEKKPTKGGKDSLPVCGFRCLRVVGSVLRRWL
uniref:Uncharacterized protein n=1 Tax=Fagus sylvatica TaxID=28930 RepID=A0A2N9HQW8_FAGSY